MELAGGTFAAERAGGWVATVAIEAMRFLRLIAVGDEVSCYCTPEKTGETSITVNMEIWARSRGGEGSGENDEGFFTYVAVQKDGKSQGKISAV